jgi:pSer/pThr/pTyr-binding forkhead associated (FHA) protein
MAKLVLSLNGNLINQYFTDLPVLRIGTASDNEIAVNDPALAPLHATIRCVGEDHILEVAEGLDGLVVNATPVDRRILQHLDTIQLGDYHLRYLNTRVAGKNNLDYTMLIDTLGDEGRTTGAVGNLAGVRGNKVHFPNGYIQVLRGVDIPQGKIVALDRVVTTFGTPGKQLMVVTRRPIGFFLSLVEGRDTPQINRQSVSAKAAPLKDGDVIESPGWELEFHLGTYSGRRA